MAVKPSKNLVMFPSLQKIGEKSTTLEPQRIQWAILSEATGTLYICVPPAQPNSTPLSNLSERITLMTNPTKFKDMVPMVRLKILEAHNEGEDLQFYSKGFDEWKERIIPRRPLNPDMAYRIKPKQKPPLESTPAREHAEELVEVLKLTSDCLAKQRTSWVVDPVETLRVSRDLLEKIEKESS